MPPFSLGHKLSIFVLIFAIFTEYYDSQVRHILTRKRHWNPNIKVHRLIILSFCFVVLDF